MRRLLLLIVALLFWFVLPIVALFGARPAHADPVLRFAPDVKRAAQAVWGIRAPTPMFLGQIKQESGGDPRVCSAYACGLAQFTPDTAAWMQRVYGTEIGKSDVFDPRWAIGALVRYDKYLIERVPGHTSCDRAWGGLRAYNGGLGHVLNEARFAADPLDHEDVDAQCGKARRSAKHCPESLGYPRRILLVNQPRYAGYGETLCLN
jgi:soluble lytic murein transglycosylase-like protein